MTTATRNLPKLRVGEQIWGYIGATVTVCGTNYREYGEVLREPHTYRAAIAGRPDYTGFQKDYPTIQQAMAAVGLPLDGEIVGGENGVYKVLARS